MKKDPKVLDEARRQGGNQTAKAKHFWDEASPESKRHLFKTKTL
jgi:hypothetical protein